MAINKTAAGTYAVNFRDQFKRRIQKTFTAHREAVNCEKESLALVAKREYVKPTDEIVKELAENGISARKPAATNAQRYSFGRIH